MRRNRSTAGGPSRRRWGTSRGGSTFPLHAITGEADEDILAGEEWDIDPCNAKLLERNRARPLDEVRADFDVSYAALLEALEALPVERLDAPSPYGGTLESLIAGNTYQHYDEHAGYIATAFDLSLT